MRRLAARRFERVIDPRENFRDFVTIRVAQRPAGD